MHIAVSVAIIAIVAEVYCSDGRQRSTAIGIAPTIKISAIFARIIECLTSTLRCTSTRIRSPSQEGEVSHIVVSGNVELVFPSTASSSSHSSRQFPNHRVRIRIRIASKTHITSVVDFGQIETPSSAG